MLRTKSSKRINERLFTIDTMIAFVIQQGIGSGTSVAH